MDLANAGLDDRGRDEALGQCPDLPEFTDYFILNLYAGNSDWDRWANWYAARPRAPGGKFRFSVWDAECSLGQLEACTLDQDDDLKPAPLVPEALRKRPIPPPLCQPRPAALVQRRPVSGGSSRPAVRRVGQRRGESHCRRSGSLGKLSPGSPPL